MTKYTTLRAELAAYHIPPAAVERIAAAAPDVVRFAAELAAHNIKDAAASALHAARRTDRGEVP